MIIDSKENYVQNKLAVVKPFIETPSDKGHFQAVFNFDDTFSKEPIAEKVTIGCVNAVAETSVIAKSTLKAPVKPVREETMKCIPVNFKQLYALRNESKVSFTNPTESLNIKFIPVNAKTLIKPKLLSKLNVEEHADDHDDSLIRDKKNIYN